MNNGGHLPFVIFPKIYLILGVEFAVGDDIEIDGGENNYGVHLTP